MQPQKLTKIEQELLIQQKKQEQLELERQIQIQFEKEQKQQKIRIFKSKVMDIAKSNVKQRKIKFAAFSYFTNYTDHLKIINLQADVIHKKDHTDTMPTLVEIDRHIGVAQTNRIPLKKQISQNNSKKLDNQNLQQSKNEVDRIKALELSQMFIQDISKKRRTLLPEITVMQPVVVEIDNCQSQDMAQEQIEQQLRNYQAEKQKIKAKNLQLEQNFQEQWEQKQQQNKNIQINKTHQYTTNYQGEIIERKLFKVSKNTNQIQNIITKVSQENNIEINNQIDQFSQQYIKNQTKRQNKILELQNSNKKFNELNKNSKTSSNINFQKQTPDIFQFMNANQGCTIITPDRKIYSEIIYDTNRETRQQFILRQQEKQGDQYESFIKNTKTDRKSLLQSKNIQNNHYQNIQNQQKQLQINDSRKQKKLGNIKQQSDRICEMLEGIQDIYPLKFQQKAFTEFQTPTIKQYQDYDPIEKFDFVIIRNNQWGQNKTKTIDTENNFQLQKSFKGLIKKKNFSITSRSKQYKTQFTKR